jgi:glycosyltransferase
MCDLTVITVVKNDEQNIISTVNSVLNQKNCTFEYIVFDGKSTDNTFNKLKKIKNKKIKIFSQKDENLYDALNKCIKKSKGEYIFLMHSGDLFYNNFVLYNIGKKLIQKPDMISGNIKFFKKKNNRIIINRVWRNPIKKINKYSIFKIPHTSMVLKKKIIKQINYYNILYSISSDMDFMIKLSKLKKLNYIYIDNFFVLMLSNGLSTSKKNFFKKLTQDYKILLSNYHYNFFSYYIFKIYFKFFQFFFFKKNK